MASVDVELPVLESLVQVGGTYATPAHHLRFAGITFTGTSWRGPSSNQGLADQQTGSYIAGTWARPADALTSCQSGCQLFEAVRPHWSQMPAPCTYRPRTTSSSPATSSPTSVRPPSVSATTPTPTQSGATVRVTNVDWNGALAPGQSATVGFLASYTGTNNAPSSVSCN